MKRKILSLLLSLSLCLSLFPAALADEAVEFTDVPAGSWFEQGVTTCAEQGVMVGTAAGLFSPDAELTHAECLMLAYRLYDMAYGGDGSLLKAPEGWGYLKIETDDGKLKHEGFSGDRNVWDTAYVRHENTTRLNLRPKDSEMLNTFIGYYYPPQGATVTLDGVEYRGTVQWVREIAYVTYYLVFTPEDESVNELLLSSTYIPAGDKWWRDLSYTLQERDLEEVFFYEPSEAAACRYTFAYLLYAAIGEQLEPLREVSEIPDLPRDEENEYVYRLYEAGILSGVDESGTFEPNKTLTRAEAAVMVARVLDERQRLTPPLSYEEMVTQLATEENYTVDWSSDGGYGTVLLRWKPLSPEDDTRDYQLWLVRWDGEAKKLLLPSTVLRPNGHNPTDRAPDSWQFGEDGKTFTYRYHFSEPLTIDDTVYHEAGTYVYTADLTTGEVTAYIDPASQQSLAYYGILGSLYTEEGYEQDYTYLHLPDGVDTVLRSRPCPGDPEKRDYEFYLIRKEAQPQLLRLPLPSTELLPDGSAPTTQSPETLQFEYEGTILTYTYRFQEPLWDGNTLLHDKGTYVYTVDVITGEQSVVLEDSYEYALAEAIEVGGTWRVDQQLETPLCTILAQHSEGGGGLFPGACITLIFKDGSPNGAGETIDLPNIKRGKSMYSSIPPHSIFLNEDKTVLTYIYQFDEDQYAVDKSLNYNLTYKAGTYTTTVDLINGTVNEVFTPKE